MQERVLQFFSRNTDAGAEARTPSFIQPNPKQTQMLVACTTEEDTASEPAFERRKQNEHY
jgi:hypothetical protein